MRSLILLLFMVVFCWFPALAQDTMVSSYDTPDAILEDGDATGFFWGLPASIIQKQEKAIFAETDDKGNLYFVNLDEETKSSITYEFQDDQLFRATIFSEKKYPIPQEMFDDLIKIKNDLIKKYGEPQSENFDWKTEDDKKYPDSWGWTVYNGNLSVTILWKTDRTIVKAFLGSYKPMEPLLFVSFEDAKYKKAKEQEKTKLDILGVPQNSPDSQIY